ncbi:MULTISPECIES: recombination regulator RecX [unclassified Clostridium]|uniref:recombination regulator RecX n=1 Tax=unclassified Clostridium TaxID=2614128 RepID=UPI0025B889A1|nr:recombination regulator RecX [Clostridium sp.]MCI6691609.1 recombination regulator RecX [Clostridium sp.]MDY2631140.1 recombination regulator RecX [Clostridium sp.]MDY4251866.1 recombination regulator RecX [Clostridium sp.]
MNVITKIEVQKRNKDRSNVYIDNDYAFSLSNELVYKEGLKLNEKIDIERINAIAKEDNYIKCKTTALRIVEKSYKSEKELVDKLILKGYDNESINKTMDVLKEYNFINDENYVKMYVKDKLKQVGKKKIKYDLAKKGISDKIIDEEIYNIDSEYEKNTAYNLAIKKYNTIAKREADRFKLSQKLYRFLLSKGYSYDIVSSVVKEITKVDHN